MKEYIEETDEKQVSITEFAKKLGLITLYDGEKEDLRFCTVSVNRPGLLLAGFLQYFGDNRVQVLGSAEQKYLETLPEDERRRVLETFLAYNIPCVILSRNLKPTDEFMEYARKYKRPIFLSSAITSNLINDLVMYLNDLLAPTSIIHGVLMDVYGIGVLLSGHSGIGKSETALELIKRGHRLVADDAVLVKNVKSHVTGTAPEAIKFLMEIRGIGIINVKEMYGVGSITDEKEIELVIELEDWQENKKYERLGLSQEYEEILGQPIPKVLMPVRPGRNLAIIVEVAARNNRLKEIGHNSAEILKNKLNV